MADRIHSPSLLHYFHNSFLRYRHTDNSRGIDCHFLARMCRGTAHIVPCQGQELVLSPGDIFYLPQGLRYHSYWFGDETTDHRVEWDSYAFTYWPAPEGGRYMPQLIQADSEGLALFEALAHTPFEPMRASGYLYLFFSHMLPTMQPDDRDPRAALLEHIKMYMAQHLDESVEEVARHCNVSPSALYQLFRERADMTTTEWRHRVRVEHAITLLRSTDLSVEEISEKSGFCSAGYFRRIVKQMTGQSPRDIRRQPPDGCDV